MRNDLQQIADMLILNGTLTACPGLVHGKMGIAIFFFHYAQYTSNTLYEDYAMDLIGEIQGQLHNNSPADYETGLAGIGVGMDYLMNNHFFCTDDDFFEDFDQRMYRAVMYDPWDGFSLYDGLSGYGKYWIMRLRQQASLKPARECLLRIASCIAEKFPDIPANEQTDVFCFLQDLQKILGFDVGTNHALPLPEQCHLVWDVQLSDVIHSFSRLGDSAVGNLFRAYQRMQYFNFGLQDEFDLGLKQIPNLDMEKSPVGTGLLAGYAGEGMLRLTALDKKHLSWLLLL